MSTAPITFLVPGQTAATRSGAPLRASDGLPGQVKARVTVGARRAGVEPVRLEAVPGEDLVVLHVAGGPALVLHPETARDMLLGQGTQTTRSAGVATGDVVVPTQLRWRSLEQTAPARSRGFLGDVLLQAVEVLTGLAKDKAVDFAASAVVAKVDGQVVPGVYRLDPTGLKPLKDRARPLTAIEPADGPLLVLLHGTFVDTASTFGKLWDLHPAQVQVLFGHYRQQVYALDHPTLGASPIDNALTLVQALPKGARLHLATHSRGGLVAEVLARVCGRGGELTADDLKPFAGAAYAPQRAALQQLAARVKQQGITVERVVRVACPARGTLLASRRLDAYLSVLRWGLQLAGIPVAPALLDFLAEVARRREDPGKLPGLAAMMPDSPLVRWLNGGEPVPGDLRVVAGDLEGDTLGSWVKTLLADAFYWTDNDIVVQTRSMYGGTPRTNGGAQFVLDQGGKVTHFNYFVNARTVGAVVEGLTQERPSGYRPIGPLSWAGEDAGGARAARARPTGLPAPADRPAVFLLPGILGSHLKLGDKRIWLSLRLLGGLERLAWPDAGASVHPDGPIGLFYDDLAEYLERTHEVIPFAFDWRRPIEEEAQRLADAIDRELALREASRQPVRLIAHSMGGLVARTVQLERPETWNRMLERSGARLLMLGTPNGGSWAPMQVLSGDDRFGNLLAAVGGMFDDERARAVMAGMPGFLQLQAGLLDDDGRLARHETWADMARRDLQKVRDANWWHRNWIAPDDPSQLSPYTWGVPEQPVLNRALALRRRLDEQRTQALPAFADRLLLVVGHARYTPDGWQWGDEGLEYLNAVDGGDGRVPLHSALLPGVRTWTLKVEHGSLPDHAEAFEAYRELLEHGDTERLPRLAAAAVRSAAGGAQDGAATVEHVTSRPSRGRQLGAARPMDSMKALLSAPGLEAEGTPAQTAERGAALQVEVCNGDLTFIGQPLMLGHYHATKVTGTEGVIDRRLGGALTASLQAGLYPQGIGEHQIFVNGGTSDDPWRAPRPRAAIVIGLGDEGVLTQKDLAFATRQATLAWLQRLAEQGEAAAAVELAATLMGSGGAGMGPGESAAAIATGVRDAAEIVRRGNATRQAAADAAGRPDTAQLWPLPTRLTLVELYLERASDAWRALQVQATAAPGHFVIGPVIVSGTGPLRRQIDTAYRGADYDLITALSPAGAPDQIAFRLDTRRARSELRSVATQATLVEQIVRRAADDTNDDTQLGRTLFQLLVPRDMEAYLGGTERMVLELDTRTARVPWELLDSPPERRSGGDPRPWAVRTRLLRKLQTARFRSQVRDAGADEQVLVVGEPKLNDPRYAPLPGALQEARAVATALGGLQGVGAERVKLVAEAEAVAILNALFERPWRIVHIAGHGETTDGEGGPGGLVMSDKSFLGPREIEQMRDVPELVFVNCCHLAKIAPEEPGRKSLDRPNFAASVAEALIEAGVRCVVAAGWAVDDDAAAAFAGRFYRTLLAGRPFIDAVAEAREAAWRQADPAQGGNGNNTWAAYQCYGDPDWVFRRGVGDAQARDPVVDEYASLSSPLGLALALEKLAVESEFQGRPLTRQLEHIRHLEARFGTLWGGMGAIAEAFGLAYAKAGAMEPAVDWYGRATAAADASASMKAHEQWLNLRARLAETQAREHAPKSRAWAKCRREVQTAVQQLEALTTLQPTVERHNLVGSSWKRLSMLLLGSDPRGAADARARSDAAYGRAEAMALAQDAPELFYPVINRMAYALAMHPEPSFPGFEAGLVARARDSAQAKVLAEPDFWSVVTLIELDAFETAGAGRLHTLIGGLLARAEDLHSRAAAPKNWASVRDNAEYALRARVAQVAGAERQALADWLDRLAVYAGQKTGG
ncbi:MAG: CHAT domain-containing protein [Burkholderiaceae bacterium]|nr:CHAT domain-containing protein [Burkholderiaceae bacterium]